MAKQAAEHIPVNGPLLNVITPMGLTFKRNEAVVGENLARAYGVIRYPPSTDIGWLSKVSNIPGTIMSTTFEPADAAALIESISRSVSQNRGVAESTRDPLTQQRAERGAADGERLMLQIDRHGETVGYMTNLVLAMGRDEEPYQKVCRKVESMFAGIRCKVRGMANLQREALRGLSPYYPRDEQTEGILKRIVPLSTFLGGFPFASMGYNDGTGCYIARDSYGGIIVLDFWKRGGDRTNSNLVIMGVAGVGKSTAVKSIILSEYARGTKVILVDPERECRDMCLALGGDWINAGGGAGGRINPLQIRPVPKDDEDENGERLYKDDGNGMGDMALHMKSLDIFVSLYLPGLDDIQRAMLKESLEEVYAEAGITWNTDVSHMPNEAFPVMADLYRHIKKKAGKDGPEAALAGLLRDIAAGSDSFIWNGHTTLQTRSRCICLDTHDLQNTSDIVKRTQYFNILTWCWEQMSRDRQERVLLVCDEAYLMIDPQVPQSLVFLRNVAKRARKYEAGIAIISHSVVDFLDPSIKMYGQALLDIPAYKILMGCDGRNLQETADLYSLTEAEQELLYAKRRGHALLMVGSKRLHAAFDLPDYKRRYMGEGGGR